MKSVLILHGKPTRERYENLELPKPHRANWLPWLSSELGKRGVVAAIPAFPEPYAPSYEKWSELFERYDVDADTALVGHSAGAEFAVRWLSQNKNVNLRQLVLVAPWKDTKNLYGEFSEYTIDHTLAQRIGKISIFNSLDDSQAIQDNVHHLRATFPDSHYVEFSDKGHFMLGNNMNSIEFPEVLDEVL